MEPMTKITKIVTELHGNTHPEIMAKYADKLLEMLNMAKTNGVVDKPDNNTFIRYWNNEESAREWLDFVDATLAESGVNYVNAEILDAP